MSEEKKIEQNIEQQKINQQAHNETQNYNADDEISLIDLFAVLLRRKWLIIGMTAFGAIASVVFSIFSLILPPEKSPLPNKYTPSSNMLINDSSSSGGGLSSLISSSGLGGLASLAGISASGGSTYSDLAIYLSQSNPFLDAIVDEFGLVEKWEIEKSPRANSRTALKKVLKTSFDTDSGVFSISFTDIDPVLACDIVNYATNYLEEKFLELGLDKNKLEKQNLEENMKNAYNEILRLQKEIQNVERTVSSGYGAVQPILLETSMLKLELQAQEEVYKQMKTQYEVLKISMASETPVFQILERPEIPDMKSAPSRGKLCIIITFAAGFLAVFLAFLLNAIENIKADPEALSKLKGAK